MIQFREVRHVTLGVDRDAEGVYAFASRPENLPLWAAGLGQGVSPAGDDWEVKTDQGSVGLRFTKQNDYGVMDHTVVLPNGAEVFVPFRVVPNGTGSEVTLTLFRQPEMDDAVFDRDAGLMLADLQSLKTLLEQTPNR